jgi:excinuclease ABC subunit C
LKDENSPSPCPALTQALPQIPAASGVYLFKDKSGRVLYVGKAVNLKNRLTSYLRDQIKHSPKTALLLSRLEQVDFLVTATEREALLLERNLIKEHHPRFNVVLRDDKNYLCLRLDLQEPVPRLALVRHFAPDGARYFGPFVSSLAVRELLKFMKRAFRLRLCKDRGIPKRSRPCLNYQLGNCLGPCAGLVDLADYRQAAQEALWFLQGQGKNLLRGLEKQMKEAASSCRFEEAARLRDRMVLIQRTLERQCIATPNFQDQDVVGLAREGDQALVLLLLVRGGMVTGNLNFEFSVPHEDNLELLEAFLKQYYTPERVVPEEILLPQILPDQEIIAGILQEQKGGPVRLLHSRQGDRRRLLNLAAENAQAALKRLQEGGPRVDPVLDLQRRLKLATPPHRLECLDISNLQGDQAVGALVAFTDGRPDKTGYRRFRIKEVNGQNDPAMLAEIIRRHYSRINQKLPDLLVIDGGRGQLAVIGKIMAELGLIEKLPVIGLAKEGMSVTGEPLRDRIYLPGRKNPLFLPPSSPALLLLMRLRDEAHRFAITYHRKRTRQKALESELSQIPGLGPKRRQQLLTHFGDLKALQQASLEDLLQIPGLPRPLARTLLEFLREKS